MRSWNSRLTSIAVGVTMMVGGSLVMPQSASADTQKPVQTLNVDYGTKTGDFLGGASGTLYGLGDEGSPTNAILDGARVENSSQKPPTGTQHPSGDALALENQFLSNGGQELAVYMQDYYPDWAYNKGSRPGDDRSYVTDVPVTDPTYGTYTTKANGRWDYDEVVEIVINKILANTEHPDNYTFIPFNEPDGGNWYSGSETSDRFKTFLTDWHEEYRLVQKIWNEYKDGEKPSKVRPTASHARIAGPGDSQYLQGRSDKFLEAAKSQNTVPDVFVWHELGKSSLSTYRTHYNQYRALEKKYGIDPLPINITEYGELRDMSVPGQLIQWMGMFEDTKVQAETAYWNYAGNLSDNMANANSANAGWWMFKLYGDLRGTQTVKVTSEHPDTIDALQGIAAMDGSDRKATVLYGGANDDNADAVKNTGANIPVKVHLTGLDKVGLSGKVDVEVRENAFTDPDGVAAAPRVVNVMSGAEVRDGLLDVTTTSVDRYASYQVVVTPHQDRTLVTDSQVGRSLLVQEAENTRLSGGATSYSKTPLTANFSDFITSGNADVGNFKNGATATWTVNVPQSGTYRLQVLSGNTGFPGSNAVTVDGSAAGTLNFGAELAMKDAAKWKYRGGAELLLNLTQGSHDITVNGSSMDNTLDKFLLYQVNTGGDSASDITEYPSTQFRLEHGAELSWRNDGADGFAALHGGEADVFVHAWNAGYHDVDIAYNAPKGTKMSVSVNGEPAESVVAQFDGLQHATSRVALSEGINQVKLTGDGVLVKSLTTSRPADAEKGTTIEAEDMKLSGGASSKTIPSSNASGSAVTGLGNQFETSETGPDGMGDRTRVVVKDSNNTPSVITNNRGAMTIPAGRIPAGTYNMVVRFSNDAFIGKHDYNPQVVDLGLQIRQGDASGAEIARGSFRYTYSDQSFMNRSIELTTDGGALTFGNWDPAGSGKGAVSWGVAPNVDSVTFYEVSKGEPKNTIDSSTLLAIEADVSKRELTVGDDLPLNRVVATYAGGGTKEISADSYKVSGFDANVPGKQKVTVSYTEGRVTRAATLEVTVSADKVMLRGEIANADSLKGSQYTVSSWNTLSKALSTAKTALSDENATKKMVDDATSALRQAREALIKTVERSADGGRARVATGGTATFDVATEFVGWAHEITRQPSAGRVELDPLQYDARGVAPGEYPFTVTYTNVDRTEAVVVTYTAEVKVQGGGKGSGGDGSKPEATGKPGSRGGGLANTGASVASAVWAVMMALCVSIAVAVVRRKER